MTKYLLTDADLETLRRFVPYATARWAGDIGLAQADYIERGDAAETLLRSLTAMPAAASALASNSLAGLQRIASAIRIARKAQGLSQDYLASKTGLQQSVISRVEKGTLALRPPQLALIGDLLGITLEAPAIDDYAGMP
jgi:ribosome-binding protein aMBF1 (putative translation factor)